MKAMKLEPWMLGAGMLMATLAAQTLRAAPGKYQTQELEKLEPLFEQAIAQCGQETPEAALMSLRHLQAAWAHLQKHSRGLAGNFAQLPADADRASVWVEEAAAAAQREDWDDLQDALVKGKAAWHELRSKYPGLLAKEKGNAAQTEIVVRAKKSRPVSLQSLAAQRRALNQAKLRPASLVWKTAWHGLANGAQLCLALQTQANADTSGQEAVLELGVLLR